MNKSEELAKIRDYEANFLNMIQKITNGTRTIISKSGEYMKMYPGPFLSTITTELEFDCGSTRSITWYLEYLTILSLFVGCSYTMKLIGVTNDEFDPSIDTFISTIPHLLSYFNISGMKINIKKRGFRPDGNGEIFASF